MTERPDDIHVVLVTAPDPETARLLVRRLVEARLVACGNVLPGVTSIYRWEGEVQEDSEVLVVLKAPARVLPALVRRVREEHPYDVPEVIALPVAGGLDAYLSWVVAECGPAPRKEP
ncbi:MAG: divalent-cation tolerance protein CutA [Gemmatimonadota bacterium]